MQTERRQGSWNMTLLFLYSLFSVITLNKEMGQRNMMTKADIIAHVDCAR